MKQLDNFIRNPTNNSIINSIKEKYILSGEIDLSRVDKKQIRNKLILAYKHVNKLIKSKNDMNKLNLILLCVLGTLVMTVTSCKKLYSGYCKYDVTYDIKSIHKGYTYNVNQYYTDLEKSSVENVTKNYDNLVKGQEYSKTTHTAYIVTGEGCKFHKDNK